MPKDQKLFFSDEYKIFDQLKNASRQKSKAGPLGWVRAYMQNKGDLTRKLFFEGPNMVVAQGRYFVAQKIFGIADGSDETAVDYRPFTISHFGVGAGGATVSGDSVDLLGPHICDISMYKPIGLGGGLNEPIIYDNSALRDDLKELYTSYGALKPISSFTLVSEDYEETGESCEYKTKVKCECVIDSTEPPALQVTGYVPISEAGLYYTYGNTARMFAHVCFPPKYKELESTITIDWFILC